MDVLEGQVLSVATPTDLELRSLAGGQSGDAQVWTLTQFFLLFVKKIIDLPGGQINPLIEETLFSSVPPSNSLVSVSDSRRAF